MIEITVPWFTAENVMVRDNTLDKRDFGITTINGRDLSIEYKELFKNLSYSYAVPIVYEKDCNVIKYHISAHVMFIFENPNDAMYARMFLEGCEINELSSM